MQFSDQFRMDSNAIESYTVPDALISPHTAAVNVSPWIYRMQKLYSDKITRIKYRKNWIKIARKLVVKNYRKKLATARGKVAQSIFENATKVLWKSLHRKALLHSRLFNIRFYFAKYQKLRYERQMNIRIQWKAYARSLINGINPPDYSYRELWNDYAFILKKKEVQQEARRYQALSFHGEEQTQIIWKEFSSKLLLIHRIRKLRQYIRSIAILTQFFHNALFTFRSTKAAEGAISFTPNYDFSRQFITQSCLEINHLAKMYLQKKSNGFSRAYADETFKTSFVHLLIAVKTVDTP